MTSHRPLTREIIIQSLADALKPLGYIHAFWEGGAVAFDRVDDYSDIDLYLVVDDEKVDDTFLAVENALKLLSPIKQRHGVFEPSLPGLSQAFYRLQDASDYLMIDVAVFKLSSPDKLLEPEIHGHSVFYFNKSGKVKQPRLNNKAFAEKLLKRLKGLQGEFDMFHNLVQKEIYRGNNLEAVAFYRMLLTWLVEALRIRYSPLHYDFRMRYIHYELPSEVVSKLERLCFIKDKDDLQEKYDEVVRWFPQTISETDKKTIERLIKVA